MTFKTIIFSLLFVCPSLVSACENSTEHEKHDQIVDADYDVYMKEGKTLLENHKYVEAKGKFNKALKVDLFESPNYEPILFLAKTLCLEGNKKVGRELLDEFECMLNVNSGSQICYTEKIKYLNPNKELSALCFETMCSEIFLSYYENLPEKQLQRIYKLNQEELEVEKLCEGE